MIDGGARVRVSQGVLGYASADDVMGDGGAWRRETRDARETRARDGRRETRETDRSVRCAGLDVEAMRAIMGDVEKEQGGERHRRRNCSGVVDAGV